jgi:hypothetical protein
MKNDMSWNTTSIIGVMSMLILSPSDDSRFAIGA